MNTKAHLKESIDHYLRERLQKAGCSKGHVTGEYKKDAPTRMTVNGTRADGKAIIFWDLPQQFRNDIDAYWDSAAAISFSITIDLEEDRFDYKKGPIVEEPPIQPVAVQLSAGPYGHALAKAVADALAHRSIGYSHRDYCGTGMEKRGSSFVFGPVWDGGMEPRLSFPDEASFVQWLAEQSDESLGGTPYNTQDICRKRLEDWLEGRD